MQTRHKLVSSVDTENENRKVQNNTTTSTKGVKIRGIWHDYELVICQTPYLQLVVLLL